MGDATIPITSVPAPTGRRERRDAAAHRQRILEVARQLFAAHGVAAISMHQIARAAGVGQGTLYRRYANKGELCKDLARDEHERFAAELMAWVNATATTLSALERLDGVLARMLTFVVEGMTLHQEIAAAEWRELVACEDGAAVLDASCAPPGQDPWLQWLLDLLARLLNEAVAEGALAPLDVTLTAHLILGALNPMFLGYLYAQHNEHADIHAHLLAGLRRIFITGITGR